ncbi:TRAP transporter substrate-binding protein DctP [[Clostridium] symbiosum]|uniref:TRAP transporter substrate-binding protein DctP n=1 Tax=Clostridium symbiosum TaxID=1512 RepID=UPI001D06AD84|nr:TRAP transporter substrate-binding protein DctP [[Clostridium] symbiosum]MCB6609608.1 TRAP transporter substrate-binding protein DctP [[Clostridium] symbiosum]MCB6933150.1 TRAP transporter substrate-binding protein DctP [[Clostridium] symbiosum]
MKLKKVLALTLAASMVMGMTGCGKKEAPAGETAAPAGDTAAPAGDTASEEAGTSGDVINFQLSLVDPETSPYGKGAKKIAEEVDKATNGRIKITVNAGGALGGERDTIELAMSNNLDIATAANSVLTNFIPNMNILDQAYLWTDVEQAHAAVDGALGDLIKRDAEKLGLHVIGFMESGFRDTFSTKPIESIDDFKGITIRTMENKYHQAAFKAFGAMPIAMNYNDVFTALQQGTIDAAENALCNCWNSGYYEVTKDITKTQHAFVYIVLCMSDKAWQQIPEDLRQPFLDAVQRGVEAERQYLVEENAEAEKKLIEAGVTMHDINVEELQAAYKVQAEKEGFTFDPEWQAAVDEAIASVK